MRVQGALMPWHWGDEQDAISVGGIMGDTNPSLQKPPEHFCPTGQRSFARHGSLAAPPFHLRSYSLAGALKYITTINTRVNNASVRPTPEVRFNAISSVVTC